MPLEYKKYELEEIADEAHGMRTFCLAPKEGEVPAYKPGQFFMMRNSHMRQEIKHNFRSYSVLHPHDGKKICFGIKLVGEFTHALWELKKGDELELAGPYGLFGLPAKPEGTHVFLAGGCGITPLLCIVEHLDKIKYGGKFVLVYSNRHPNEIAYGKVFDEIASRNKNFEAIYTLTGSDVPQDWCGLKGRISIGMLRERIAGFENANYYMCGPKQLIESIGSQLIEAGVKKENVHSEKW